MLIQIDVSFGTNTAVATYTFANTLPTAYQPAGSVDIRCAAACNNPGGTFARFFVGSAGGSSPGQVQLAGASGDYEGTYSAQVRYSVI